MIVRVILKFWNWEIGKFLLEQALTAIPKFPNSKISKCQNFYNSTSKAPCSEMVWWRKCRLSASFFQYRIFHNGLLLSNMYC
jgi:hypothetical protein